MTDRFRRAGSRVAAAVAVAAPVVALSVALAVMSCSGAPGEAPPEPQARPANLLILSVDTLRADAVGAGTPHFEDLAQRGVSFDRAYTPFPRTTPGFASLHTGLVPSRHGSREVGDPLAAGVTLAEVLRKRGFATLAVSANAAAGPPQGLDRGFDRFVAFEDLEERYGPQVNAYVVNVTDGATPSADAVTEEALRLLDERPQDAPFALWVVYLEPHFLYFPPSAWNRDPAGNRCLELYEHYLAHIDEAGQVFSDVGGVSSRALADCKSLYAEEAAYADRQAGRLLAGLADRGLLEDTLVVFTADHGENQGEGGLYYEHGNNLAEAAVRVPLVLAGPGIPVGERVTTPVGLIDVMPTALALLGVPADEQPPTDGLDLAPLFAAGSPPERRLRERQLVAESGAAMWNEAVDRLVTGRAGQRVCINRRPLTLCRDPEDGLALFDHVADPKLTHDLSADRPEEVAELLAGFERWTPHRARLWAGISERFKLVLEPRFEGGWSRRLIDLEADPDENHDVAAAHPEALAALSALVERHIAVPDASTGRRLDPETEETLRSLGYLN